MYVKLANLLKQQKLDIAYPPPFKKNNTYVVCEYGEYAQDRNTIELSIPVMKLSVSQTCKWVATFGLKKELPPKRNYNYTVHRVNMFLI